MAYYDNAPPESVSYWQGLEADKLVLPKCLRCERLHFPPLPKCPHCGSRELVSVDVDGLGTIVTWTVAYYAFSQEFADQTPYIIAMVRLDVGPRIYGLVRGVDPGAELADLRVGIRIERRPTGPIPVFAPIAEIEEGRLDV